MTKIPICIICKKQMDCIENGCNVIFNKEIIDKRIDKCKIHNIECGRGDLFKCKKCETHSVDGFNIILKEVSK